MPQPHYLSMGLDNNGLLNIFTLSANSTVYRLAQSAKNDYGTWQTSWSAISGANIVDFVQPVGNWLFGVDASGNVYQAYQQASGAWSNWSAMPGAYVDQQPYLAAAMNHNGTLEVFIGTSSGTKHCWQNTPGATQWSNWSGWYQLGNLGDVLTDCSVGLRLDNQLQVIGPDTPGGQMYMYSAWQGPGNGGWTTPWSQFANISSYQNSVSCRNADGRLEIFLLDAYGNLSHAYQQSNGIWTPPNGTGWPVLGTGLNLERMCPVVDKNGKMNLFATRSRDVQYIYQIPGTQTGWSGWQNAGSGFDQTNADFVYAALNADQTLEVVAATSNFVRVAWLTSAGWQTWVELPQFPTNVSASAA